MTSPGIVLASRSPRRRQLLEMLGISHVVDPVEIDERQQAGEDPEPFAQRLAREKAVAGSKRHPGKWVLGADTIVVLDKETLGKPSSPDEAEEMLLRLAGKCHRVVSAVALARGEDVHAAHDVTSVWMRSVSRETARQYVATGEPLDKAGSYAIQGVGAVLVDRIEGDYFGVMGLPVRLVVELMRRAGIPYNFSR
ncbi:MAG: nucleoside triphosphate pyrophosphatase [Gemmatimonadales bacterium]